jgi:hypothetical protein
MNVVKPVQDEVVCVSKKKEGESEGSMLALNQTLPFSFLFLLLNPGHLVPLLYRLLIFTKSTHQVPSQ